MSAGVECLTWLSRQQARQQVGTAQRDPVVGKHLTPGSEKGQGPLTLTWELHALHQTRTLDWDRDENRRQFQDLLDRQ